MTSSAPLTPAPSPPASPPKSRERVRAAQAVLYLGPLFLWAGLLFVMSTTFGRYETTLYAMGALFRMLDPDHAPLNVHSLYGVHNGLRRLAHPVSFAILTWLLARAIQWGEPHLKRATAAVALLLSVLYAAANAAYRHFYVRGRHGDVTDVLLDLLGAVVVVALLFLGFALHAYERRLLAAAKECEELTTPEEANQERDENEPEENKEKQ